jgi:hypothetical protein
MKFRVEWSNVAFDSHSVGPGQENEIVEGSVVVEAEDKEEARRIVRDNMCRTVTSIKPEPVEE